MRALISGATGLVGTALLDVLPDPAILTRNPTRAQGRLAGVPAFQWNPDAGTPPDAALQDVSAIFHLAGEPVASGRWSKQKLRRIHDSRVLGTRHLVAGLAASEHRPKVLVCASAVGYYGDRGDEILDETSAAGSGFLADVCQAWEREALAARELGVRVACMRIGMVLAQSGGALPRMLLPFRLGVGGRLGSGRQWMPWIHLDDVVGLLLHASRTESVSGPVNVCAPEPVRNAEFTRALARALGRPALLPVPATALRVALGGMSSVVLASQRVLPRVAEREQYAFEFPELEGAFGALLGSNA